MPFLTPTLLLLCLYQLSCSTAQVYENDKNEKNIAKAIGDAGGQLQLMKEQLTRHKKIQKSLLQQHRALPEVLNESSRKLIEVEAQYTQLKSNFERFHALSREFTAFAHSRPQVYSHDPDWAAADQWQKTLTQQSEQFNQQLKNTEQAFNNLSQYWQAHGLFRKQAVAGLANELQSDTETSRATYNQLANDFNLGQNNFNLWQSRRPSSWGAPVENVLQPLQAMQKNLNQLAQLIKALDQLKENYFSEFNGLSEVTSLDGNWSSWEKFEARRKALNIEFIEAAERCKQFYNRFNQDLQAPAKSSPQPTSSDADQTQSPQ